MALGLMLAGLQSCGGVNEPAPDQLKEDGIKITESDQGYLFQEGDSPVLFYQRAPKSFEGAYTRNNYLHPLWTLDGEILTEDGPEDHLHQRGIFWTWHQTYAGEQRLGDAWACQDFTWDVQQSMIEDEPEGGKALSVKVLWRSPALLDENGEQKPVVEESTRILVYPAQPSYRAIDVIIQLRALEDEVKIGGSEDEKGYGGFSARIKMPEDLLFRSSGGIVEAQTTQVEVGPWVNFEGSFGKGGRRSSLAILVHPSNPGSVDKWILRKSGSMQNPVYPGRGLAPISKDEPTILKYRLLVHAETPEGLDLDSLYEEYSGKDAGG